jgi:glutamine synthetase
VQNCAAGSIGEPILTLAAMLAAALDGIDNDLPVPEPLNDINVYHLTPEERASWNIADCPDRWQKLRLLEGDETLKEALGPVTYESHTPSGLKSKNTE